MDSLPTGSRQSWLIVAAVALSPIIILFLADTSTGSSVRQGGKRGVDSPGTAGDGIAQ